MFTPSVCMLPGGTGAETPPGMSYFLRRAANRRSPCARWYARRVMAPPDGGRQAGRHGRLPGAERAARREQILNAALEEITERGYEQATMARIARRAGASKETLYAWFGDKTGLASALIETSAFQTVGIPNPDTVDGQYTHEAARQALSTYSHELLVLITGRHSIALNRAAMSSPALAKVFRQRANSRNWPIVRSYLSRLHEVGVVNAPNSSDALGLLFGLLAKDLQVQTLLGVDPPSPEACQQRAVRAVDDFLRLTSVDRPDTHRSTHDTPQLGP